MESPFTVSAKPGHDIWKQPPSHDVFTAPSRTHSSGPLQSLISATLTFTLTYTHQYDHAGLLLTLTRPGSSQKKWIKTGIEYFNNHPRFSTVGCDNFSDWSLAPVPEKDEAAVKSGDKSATIVIEWEKSVLGLCWWISRIDDAGEKVPLRQLCWPFGEDGWDVEVGAAVARPNKDITEELEAKFENFEVKWEST
ncbi:hypothetical protein FOBRF1_006922 [Fusarium oxysporum]